MNMLHFVAQINKYDSWKELVRSMTKKKVKFNIPNFFHYNNSKLIYSIVLNSVKEAGLKLTVNKSGDGLLISK